MDNISDDISVFFFIESSGVVLTKFVRAILSSILPHWPHKYNKTAFPFFKGKKKANKKYIYITCKAK